MSMRSGISGSTSVMNLGPNQRIVQVTYGLTTLNVAGISQEFLKNGEMIEVLWGYKGRY